MDLPGMANSHHIYVTLGVAHEAALLADPATAHLAESVRTATQQVREAGNRRQAASERSVAALALRNRADYELDRLVRRVDLDALRLSDRDRKRSPYRDLFPHGVTSVVTAPLQREIDQVRTIENRIREIPDLASQAEPLKTAREQLESTIAAYREAVRVEAEAAAALAVAKSDWLRQMRASYGALLVLFGDRRRAESYFARTRDSGTEADEQEPAPGGSPATPGTPA
jgi:hypothetical protein